MSGGMVKKVEGIAVALASAVFAGAVAFCSFSVLAGLPVALQAAASGIAGAACALSSWRLLTGIGRARPDFSIAEFAMGAVHIPDPTETLDLVDVYQQPLELVDVLEQIGPGSRVVHLFDPAAMPSPGELRARIDRHLGRGAPPAASPDASQALVEALTQLRQSLR